MLKSLLPLFILFVAAACGQTNGKKNTGAKKNNKGENMQEGKDYVIMKRFRLVDQSGFNQPVEASSFMLPANWKVSSGIEWNGLKKCLPEMVQASIQAQSPDGDYELLLLPVTQFDWSDDPVYLDAMQRGFNMHSCTIARPLDAAGYISQGLAPMLQAQVVNTQTIAALQQQIDAAAQQMTNTARQGGNNAYSHQGSAAEGVLKFNDGREGMAFCALMQTIVSLPGTQGGMATTTQCYVSMRVVIKYRSGNADMARKIISNFFSSARINPVWLNAVQAFYLAIGRGAQEETWKQVQITTQAQQEISNNIVRSWEARNSRPAGGADGGADPSQFSQYLRGVDSWTDEGGNKVELTSGYSNAWSRSDGSYLLSNNPAFDPNVEIQGTQGWNRMKQ